MKGLIIVVGLCSVTATLAAQDTEPKKMEEIIVTASRTDAKKAMMTNQVTIVGAEKIRQAITVSDSMSGVLESTVPGYSGSTSSQTLRGISLRGGNPLILVDGIPQYVSMFDSNKESNPIDMDFVSKVEVIHGATALQGIGGTGGVLNLVTKSPSATDGFSQDITIRTSFHESFKGDSLSKKIAYTAGLNSGDFNLMLGLSRNDRGMSYDDNGDVVGLVRYSGSIGDTETDNLLLKGNYTSGTHSLTLMHSALTMEGKKGWGPVAGCHPNRCDLADVKLQSAERGWDNQVHALPQENDNQATSLDYVNKDVFSWKLVAQYYQSDFDYRFGGTNSSFYSDDYDNPMSIVAQTAVESKKDGFRFTLSRTFIDSVDITLGYDSASEETTQIIPQNGMAIIPPTELVQSAPFVYANWEITDQLTLNAGIRRVDSEVSMPSFTPIPYYFSRGSGPVTGGSTDSTDTVSNFGAMFNITDKLSVYASLTEGFELAEVGRVVRANGISQGITLSNDYLAISPNIHENMEVGIRYNDGVTSLEVIAFEQDAPFGNSYVADEEGLLTIDRLATRRNGYNVIFKRTLSDDIDLGISYSHVDARSDTNADGTYDTDLIALSAGAPDQLKLHLDFALNNWDGRLSWINYSSKVFKNTEYSFDGYDIANLSLSREFNNDSSVGIGVHNFLNKSYIDLYSQISRNNNWYVAGAGRTMSLSYNKRF